ncbi:hypothetical protein CVV68_21960 [Arthrobacter livingstonensis]|uniref:Uncharacterized protein n=1 Tax=Arthrobacter livingstonensis TaxID=670078 RepID=A0A2V5L420_9MICC|nr:hypothetical protein [Arthrobacter livingstonensis]PYI64453.1 hypothetical protein CVV68_21960 [Arthrobacter livingstonensis]
MKAKLAFIAGLGAEYFVGTRFGRKGHASLKNNARSLWKSEPLQATINMLDNSIKSEAEDLGAKVVQKISGNSSDAAVGTHVAAGGSENAPLPDVDSDPALNTDIRQDWSDEGGALPSGPAS